MTTFVRHLTLAAAAAAVAACSDGTTGPGGSAPLSHEISVDELGQALDTAPARIEVELRPGTLVAREIEIKTPDEMSDEESIRGPVTAVAASGGGGTLTYGLGGLEVTFSSSARFRDADGSDVTMDEFAAAVQDALAAGMEPSVRAKRRPGDEPQAPDDAAFEATDLRISDDADEPEIELNVDIDNFVPNDTPPPDAWLLVLGLEIEIRGDTEIEADDDRRDEGEVEGIVASVDVAGGTVTLTSGAVIIVSDDAIEQESGSDDDHLRSLQAVADAVAAGLRVEAEAEGVVESTDPLTIRAREAEFEIEDHGDDHGHGGGDDDGEDDH